MKQRNCSGELGLDYREARKRYAPHIVACTRCDTLVTTPLERAERLCHFCLDACGRGMVAEQAQRRIVRVLNQRLSHLQR
jgi:hypothetical protein